MKDFAEAESWSELPLTMAAKGAVLVRRGALGEETSSSEPGR